MITFEQLEIGSQIIKIIGGSAVALICIYLLYRIERNTRHEN